MDETLNKFVQNIRLSKLMLRLIKQPDKKIEPEINPTIPTGYSYEIAEEYIGKNAKDELDRLADDGLLEKEFFSKELGCPQRWIN